jgi:hypothetical protein
MDIEKFFLDLEKDNNLNFSFNCVDIGEIDHDDAFNSILEMLENGNAFDIEITYYSEAMKYLTENDNSLTNSLKLANDYGFDLENLNSEKLASLLASEEARDAYNNLENEINDFFQAIEE